MAPATRSRKKKENGDQSADAATKVTVENSSSNSNANVISTPKMKSTGRILRSRAISSLNEDESIIIKSATPADISKSSYLSQNPETPKAQLSQRNRDKENIRLAVPPLSTGGRSTLGSTRGSRRIPSTLGSSTALENSLVSGISSASPKKKHTPARRGTKKSSITVPSEADELMEVAIDVSNKSNNPSQDDADAIENYTGNDEGQSVNLQCKATVESIAKSFLLDNIPDISLRSNKNPTPSREEISNTVVLDLSSPKRKLQFPSKKDGINVNTSEGTLIDNQSVLQNSHGITQTSDAMFNTTESLGPPTEVSTEISLGEERIEDNQLSPEDLKYSKSPVNLSLDCSPQPSNMTVKESRESLNEHMPTLDRNESPIRFSPSKTKDPTLMNTPTAESTVHYKPPLFSPYSSAGDQSFMDEPGNVHQSLFQYSPTGMILDPQLMSSPPVEFSEHMVVQNKSEEGSDTTEYDNILFNAAAAEEAPEDIASDEVDVNELTSESVPSRYDSETTEENASVEELPTGKVIKESPEEEESESLSTDSGTQAVHNSSQIDTGETIEDDMYNQSLILQPSLRSYREYSQRIDKYNRLREMFHIGHVPRAPSTLAFYRRAYSDTSSDVNSESDCSSTPGSVKRKSVVDIPIAKLSPCSKVNCSHPNSPAASDSSESQFMDSFESLEHFGDTEPCVDSVIDVKSPSANRTPSNQLVVLPASITGTLQTEDEASFTFDSPSSVPANFQIVQSNETFSEISDVLPEDIDEWEREQRLNEGYWSGRNILQKDNLSTMDTSPRSSRFSPRRLLSPLLTGSNSNSPKETVSVSSTPSSSTKSASVLPRKIDLPRRRSMSPAKSWSPVRFGSPLKNLVLPSSARTDVDIQSKEMQREEQIDCALAANNGELNPEGDGISKELEDDAKNIIDSEFDAEVFYECSTDEHMLPLAENTGNLAEGENTSILSPDERCEVKEGPKMILETTSQLAEDGKNEEVTTTSRLLATIDIDASKDTAEGDISSSTDCDSSKTLESDILESTPCERLTINENDTSHAAEVKVGKIAIATLDAEDRLDDLQREEPTMDRSVEMAVTVSTNSDDFTSMTTTTDKEGDNKLIATSTAVTTCFGSRSISSNDDEKCEEGTQDSNAEIRINPVEADDAVVKDELFTDSNLSSSNYYASDEATATEIDFTSVLPWNISLDQWAEMNKRSDYSSKSKSQENAQTIEKSNTQSASKSTMPTSAAEKKTGQSRRRGIQTLSKSSSKQSAKRKADMISGLATNGSSSTAHSMFTESASTRGRTTRSTRSSSAGHQKSSSVTSSSNATSGISTPTVPTTPASVKNAIPLTKLTETNSKLNAGYENNVIPQYQYKRGKRPESPPPDKRKRQRTMKNESPLNRERRIKFAPQLVTVVNQNTTKSRNSRKEGRAVKKVKPIIKMPEYDLDEYGNAIIENPAMPKQKDTIRVLHRLYVGDHEEEVPERYMQKQYSR
ncbi:hypothetical protein V1511DRAFT_488646 [Dipodascopsis uninucleata]